MFFETINSLVSWRSLLDIGLVSILFYQIISMLRGTRAAQVLIGMLVIFVAYVFSSVLQFETLHWIISKFYSSFIIVVIVLFQDDIRRLLSRFGKGPFFTGLESRSGVLVIEEIVSAAKSLSHERIGALVVFERSIGLNKLYDHSVQLDAMVSEQLLMSVFQSFSPLHDGAVIVQKNRITCASAQLPLSKNPLFSKKLGTRHSAAVGISEETDAVVLVVSEETGNISIAWEGNLQKQTSPEHTKQMLNLLLIPRLEQNAFIFWLEDNVFIPLNKTLLRLRNYFFPHSENSALRVEKRQSASGRRNNDQSKAVKEQVFKLVEHENKLAKSSSHNFYMHSAREQSRVGRIISSEAALVLSRQQTSQKVLSIKNEGEMSLSRAPLLEQMVSQSEEEGFGETPVYNQNEALKSISDLPLEDRFDPPIPKPLPPRDVSIGGISLTHPVETDVENQSHSLSESKEKKSPAQPKKISS